MGWTSYLEDIVDRLDDDLRRAKGGLESPSLSVVGRQDILDDWHARAERAFLELQRYAELATDPEVHLAAEVFELEQRRKLLVEENEKLGRERADALQELERLQRHGRELQEKVKAMRKRNAKLLEAVEADPEALYAKYTEPDRLRRLRRDNE